MCRPQNTRLLSRFWPEIGFKYDFEIGYGRRENTLFASSEASSNTITVRCGSPVWHDSSLSREWECDGLFERLQCRNIIRHQRQSVAGAMTARLNTCRSLHHADILIIVPHNRIKMVHIALIIIFLLSYCYCCHSKRITEFHNNCNQSFQISVVK